MRCTFSFVSRKPTAVIFCVVCCKLRDHISGIERLMWNVVALVLHCMKQALYGAGKHTWHAWGDLILIHLSRICHPSRCTHEECCLLEYGWHWQYPTKGYTTVTAFVGVSPVCVCWDPYHISSFHSCKSNSYEPLLLLWGEDLEALCI